ncbi:MAG: NADP-dependent oxidoreductase [Deferribacterota bacterium]|nr:NADP-dependent oxidoreductase [Deferribacterota bacterium]
MVKSTEIRLKSRPTGYPTMDNFEIASAELPEVKEGQILVQNLYMSVDPYMRGRMNNQESYIEPFKIGEPLNGDAVGVVVKSKNSDIKEGDYVTSLLGFREYFILDQSNFKPAGLEVIKPNKDIDLSAYLSVLGMPGFTAYVGLFEIGALQEGEDVFVSAAAGAVGSTACQIAKIKNCYVVGTAGSNEKVDWLINEAKIDNAFNYKEVSNYNSKLRELFNNGIDVYYENVGGKLLEAALNNMDTYGRMVMCGLISQYNNTKPEPGPYNLFKIIEKRISMRGFIVFDHIKLKPQFRKDMQEWIKAGRIKWKQTVYEGINKAPQALIDLFYGKNFGKMVVKLA